MFFTSIIPTVGRKALRRAVHSVLEQGFSSADYEIIVINDSGSPLPKEEWQNSPLVKVINTDHVERCVGRNVGAAIARGQYLHFLDDDDWLLPGALDIFWKLSHQYENHSWLFGGTLICDREDQPVIHLIHRLEPNCFAQVMAGEWIPLQASFINRIDFHKVGGFNPLIPGIEDMDLARRMALHFDFHGTGELVAGVGMGIAGSTTDQSKARLDGRQARELILNEPRVYQRLWQSANTAYWYGRIVRVYLTSAVWNLSHRRFFTAISRIFHGLRAIFASLFSSLFQRDFWRAITGPYESETFARGLSERKDKKIREMRML
ncbi:MAG: glycosyltransferase family A protein [Chloroflexota bacterium]